MIDSVFKIVQNGLCKEVTEPVFGKQHQGVAPGGAMDLFSFQMGNLLLNKNNDVKALEIIIAPVMKFTCDCWFVLTGARYDQVTLKQKDDRFLNIPFATVCQAQEGDALSFGSKQTGFRSYLSCLPIDSLSEDLTGRCRCDYGEVYNWVDQKGAIRILEGPEYKYLTDASSFTNTYWKITNDFSDMGFRLSSRNGIPEVTLQNMISEAVADGTIQLTPKGPIVLLKYRQTVGGYPRIYNVISADVDLLGQYAPNQILRFSKINIEQALTIAAQKQAALSMVANQN